MKQYVKLLALIVVFGAVIDSSISAHAAAGNQPANVLLLIVDDLNTWLLEDPTRYAGQVVAPNIQRLAKEGVLFHNAHTASPVCSPSRTAFLSGVAPWKSGVSRNGVKVGDSKVLRGVPSLFKTFQDQGYWIAKFGKVSHGYDTGVEYDASMNHKRTPPPPGAPLNGIARSASGKLTERDWGPTHLEESQMSDKLLADAAIKAIRRKHDKPFFISCGLLHPHYPWYVPQAYLDKYPLDAIELPPVRKNDLRDASKVGQSLVNLGWDQKIQDKGLTKQAIRGYLASVTFSDAHIGRVLNALDNSPHRDDTIVILISDHGFHLGEKQQWTKATLWEEATDSVMMFRVPGVTMANQVCLRPVSLLDIYPTLIDLVGWSKPDHLDGESLLPLLKDPQSPRTQPAITVYDGHMSVRTETHRYIRYWDGTTELYNRIKDPHEWVNQTDNPKFRDIKATLAGYLPPHDQVTQPLPSRQKGATNYAPRTKKPRRKKSPGVK